MNPTIRALWLALMIFFSSAVGLLAGLLTRSDGDSVPSAVLTGGASFGGTLLLLLAVVHFATGGIK